MCVAAARGLRARGDKRAKGAKAEWTLAELGAHNTPADLKVRRGRAAAFAHVVCVCACVCVCCARARGARAPAHLSACAAHRCAADAPPRTHDRRRARARTRLRSRARAQLAVRGSVYDLTAFADRHPGGRTMLLLAAGRDATELFESYHPDTSLVEPVLAKYEAGALAAPEGAPPADALPTYPPVTPFYAELKRRVHAYIDGESRYGQQWHDGPTQFARFAVITSLIFGFMYASLSARGCAAAVALAAAAGVSRALSGVHILHDASHGSLGRNPRWWQLLGVYGNDVINGTSYFMWQHQHLLIHHVYCNVPGVDDDMASEPAMRFHEGVPHKWFHRFQALYAIPLYGLMGVVTRVRDVRNFVRGYKGDCKLRPPSAGDRLAFWGGKAAFFALQLALPLALGFSPARVALQFAASDCLGGMYLASCFQCSHIAEGVSTQAHAAGGGQWAEEQVATTQDYGHGSLLTYLMTGGLNYQVVHHLLPGVSQVRPSPRACVLCSLLSFCLSAR